jgi:hypothetical protein
MMEDDNKPSASHFSAKDIIKAEKGKSKKQKKKLQKANLDLQDDFQMDLNDPRFTPLIEDHQFFIDPTNSQFKNTKTMQKILSKKRDQRENETEPTSNVIAEEISASIALNSLVNSVKRKTALGTSKGRGKRTKL